MTRLSEKGFKAMNNPFRLCGLAIYGGENP